MSTLRCFITALMLSVIGLVASINPSAPTVEVAPGVFMPLVNLGISNHSLWLESGGRGIDTAFVYGDPAQAEVGKAIRESGLTRESIFVTSKVPCCPAHDWLSFCNSTDAACNKVGNDTAAQAQHDFTTLGLDYVDLMLIHWPCNTLEQTLATYRALENLVPHKARAIGFSNFNAELIDQMMPHVKVKPAVNQAAFSIAGHSGDQWGRNDATVRTCKKHGITFEAYSPLGGWALGGTGRVLKDPTVMSIAAKHNKTSAQVALKWVVQQGIVVVTASDEKKYDLSDLDLWDFELTDKEVAALAALK